MPRPVHFELTIENRGTNPYRVSQLAVSAVANGLAAEQVIDPVQGYTGIVSAGESIPAGQTTRVTLAFAMPEQRADVTVTMQSNAAGGGGSCVFAGTG